MLAQSASDSADQALSPDVPSFVICGRPWKLGDAIHSTVIGCTRLRAVSGILRTQRGRRGNGLRRLRADTAHAGLALRNRAGPPSLPETRHHPCGSSLRRVTSRPCGSTLAGVGQCPLAIGHGCLVGLLAGVLDRPYRHCRPRRRAVGRAQAGSEGSN